MTSTNNNAVGLSFDNGGQLTVVEGDSYVIHPVELKGLDINSFMNVLRHALPKAFTAENSDNVVRIKGPRGFLTSFKVHANKRTLVGLSDLNGIIFQYPVGRINPINLLKRVFKNARVEPSDAAIYTVLKEKITELSSVNRVERPKRHAIFSDPMVSYYIMSVRHSDSLNEMSHIYDLTYKIALKDGAFLFVGEYSYDEEYYGDKTTTIDEMLMEIDALKERIERSRRIKSLVESCRLSFAFSLTPDDLANKRKQ